MDWLSKLGLKKEAILLDSKWYILKTFLAISTAFVLMSQVELVHRDMISVLFGLVLTLEPVNRMGIKNGWDQIFASLIGAITTSIIILIFGVNPLSIGASVASTLYICLLLNWKSVSPVALFTAIYMTQYLQLGPDGNPSVWITFQLRFAALGSGVLIAVIYNYLFSLIQYKKISHKRSIYLFKQLLRNLEETREALNACQPEDFRLIRLDLIETSNHIEWVYSLFQNMAKEAGSSMLTPIQKTQIEESLSMVSHVRNANHMLFDIAYIIGEGKLEQKELKAFAPDLRIAFETIADNLGSLKRFFEQPKLNEQPAFKEVTLQRHPQNEYAARILRDLRDLNDSIGKLKYFE